MADIKQYIPETNVQENLGGKIRAIYDFDVHGGAVGVITLGPVLPKGAIVTKGYIHVLTAVAPTSTSLISVGLNSNVDLRAAANASNLTLNAIVPLLPSFTAAIPAGDTGVAAGIANAAPILLTADRSLKVAITDAAFTAGKFAIVLEYEGSFEGVTPVTYGK
jgi:hypothetical protein